VATLPFRALLLCSLALVVGCSKEAPQAVEKVEASPTPAPQPTTVSKKAHKAVEKVEAVEEKSTPEAPVAVDDFKILDVVLLDLLDYEDFNTPSRRKAAIQIILDPMTVGGFSQNDEHQLKVEVDFYHKVQAISEEIAEDLKRRNPEKPISLAGYKSPSPMIVVEKLIPEKIFDSSTGEYLTEEASQEYRFRMAGSPRGCGYLIAWLPGYSKDGNTAVLRAHCGPWPHGATLTYKLARKDGRWTVVWRFVSRYM
jgi:hypothetical protein